jgi:cyanophycinase
MELSEARGRLVVIGGAEDLTGECIVLKEFLRLAKGARARICVLTIATDHPKESGAEYVAAFKRLGVDDVQVVDVSQREEAGDETRLAAIKRATGLYFTGGDQLHVTSLLGGTEMQKLIAHRYERGLVVAGTSAGAAMMSNSMILGGRGDAPPKLEGAQIGPGMDLLVGAIIDTHFSARGRFGRLLTAVAHYPQDLGIGIDEDTALVVDKTECEVVGSGSVTFIDGGSMSYTNLPYAEEQKLLALYGVTVHVLPAGHRFDLPNRKPLEPKRAAAQQGAGRALSRRNENGRVAAPAGQPTNRTRRSAPARTSKGRRK